MKTFYTICNGSFSKFSIGLQFPSSNIVTLHYTQYMYWKRYYRKKTDSPMLCDLEGNILYTQ